MGSPKAMKSPTAADVEEVARLFRSLGLLGTENREKGYGFEKIAHGEK